MLGVDQLPDAFVERVTDETAGNAFFVEEVMRTLIENESVYLEKGQWAAREQIGDLPIPSSMEAVFRRRTSFLGAGARAVLDLMSVHGQPIPADLLQSAGGFDLHALYSHLSELHRRQMVQPVAGEARRYALLHDRMRETLYADLGDQERRNRHLRIGEAIEGRSDADAYVYELAHHFWHARDTDRGFVHCLRAAERAERGYANDRAIELYERTLQLLPAVRRRDSHSLAMRIAETLGDLFTLQGKFAQAVARYQTVLAAGVNTRDGARLSRKLGQVHWQKGELADAATALWNAVEQLGEKRPMSKPAQAAATLASVLAHVGHRAFGLGRYQHPNAEERSRLLELTSTYFSLAEVYFFHNPSEMLLPTVRASNRGETAGGDSKQLVVAYSAIMVVYGTLTMWGSAAKYARKLAEMGQRLESDWHVGIGHTYWLILHYYRAKWREGIEAGARARDLLLRCGDMAELSFVYWLLALCHYYRGNLREALAVAQEGIATMERSDSAQPSKGILAVAARVQARLGNIAAANDLIARSAALCERTHDRFFSTWVEMMKGDCHLLAGELDEAVVCLQNARASREKHGLLPEYLVEIYPLLATAMLEQLRASPEQLDAAARRRRLGEISAVARKAMLLSRRRHCYYAPALRIGGAAAFLAGDERRAARLFGRSLAHAERVGATLQLGETHFEMGRCLMETKAGDRARPHFEAALSLFEKAEARTFVQRLAPHLG
jgi:tetratricopeptide (TPR) repeat protein